MRIAANISYIELSSPLRISSRTSLFLVHFQPLIGQVGDAPAYVHQAAQKVKLGDAPTCFHLGLNILGLGRFGCWALISFSFYLT